ncbi:MAG TPA: hypothetical protein VJ783_20500 [Pirellulales bacterium]|nr:hypothetical protein [Pirellulales bacterium]
MIVAEFSFFGTWNDSWELLGSILEVEGPKFVPDLKYDTDEPLFISTVDDSFKAMMLERRHTFIWSSNFSVFPPLLRRISAGAAKGKYFVDLSARGPALELTLPVCYRGARGLELGAGVLAYGRRTFNPSNGAWEGPSGQLIRGYAEVKNRLKDRLVRGPRTRNKWFGPEALRLIEAGEAIFSGDAATKPDALDST